MSSENVSLKITLRTRKFSCVITRGVTLSWLGYPPPPGALQWLPSSYRRDSSTAKAKNLGPETPGYNEQINICQNHGNKTTNKHLQQLQQTFLSFCYEGSIGRGHQGRMPPSPVQFLHYHSHSEGCRKVMFSQVSVCLCLSVHTPSPTGYTAVGMPLAVTQEKFLVFMWFLGKNLAK